jgi:N-acetylmuramoyl-L-alanine amidase
MAKVKICLDAGHYGKYNRSPVVKEYYESNMTWDLHNRLKKYLEEYGIEVIQTRSSKAKDMELADRGKKAKGCDLFLSLHSNAASAENVDYVVCMYQVDDNCGKMDERSKDVAKKLADCVAKVMGAEAKTWSTKSGKDRDGNGYKDDYYGVLRGAHSVGVAGVIIEHGFHTNKAQAEWLLKDSNLDKLAKAEADVIAAHFGVKKPESKPVVKPTATATKKATDPAKSFLRSIAGTYKVTASSLNVRNGAGVAKKKMVAIPKGTAVQCYGYYTSVLGVKWLYIQFTYKNTVYTGFASSKYLKK